MIRAFISLSVGTHTLTQTHSRKPYRKNCALAVTRPESVLLHAGISEPILVGLSSSSSSVCVCAKAKGGFQTMVDSSSSSSNNNSPTRRGSDNPIMLNAVARRCLGKLHCFGCLTKSQTRRLPVMRSDFTRLSIAIFDYIVRCLCLCGSRMLQSLLLVLERGFCFDLFDVLGWL